ncbi:hypothetical protein [Tannerella forsythia]|uniref:Exo-alpha-sialidase n=1 Tax=Tannerella forsythia TaxID=28112 RepID=A0A1D3USI6_TANFO|nr:hypothetical protein [Tannerella forsythia]TPE18182.1 hypothetical protein FJN16_06540 [Tannerella forsythia]BAR50018.1 hypothetical protein TF3313_2589 [Tannerella forsythia 3313]SCQ23246.1 hypothetical protein TFUB4_02397 [Tannerella forsythia]SCQ24295.1 hypothetical protein TFUB20_02422 [Tannerella forsythia]
MCQPQNVGGGVFLHWHEDGVYLSADDGRTWHGFRELYLDPRRDAADFGTAFGIDKSVHQSQFVETEPGRVLVSLGQSAHHRVMLIFDVDWLMARSRFCNFSDSLRQWSVFSYYKGNRRALRIQPYARVRTRRRAVAGALPFQRFAAYFPPWCSLEFPRLS